MTAAVTRAVLGTLPGIADMLASASVETDDLYAVAAALDAAREGVLDEALRRLVETESYALAVEHQHIRNHQNGAPTP